MILPVLLTIWLIQVAGSSNPEERNFGHERVLENILKNYRDAQFLVRPAQTTSAKIGFVLSYIKSFNRKNGRLTAGYLQKESWVDPRLRWEDLSVTSIHLPPDRIWKPDWRVFNSLEYVQKLDKSVLPLVDHNGTVVWIPPAEYTTVCSRDQDADADDGDSWRCEIKIGSWTLTANQMTHHFYDESTLIDVSHYYKPELNGYEVEALPGEIVNSYYSCCSEPYQHASFRFRLRLIEGGVASGVSSVWPSAYAVSFGYLIYANV